MQNRSTVSAVLNCAGLLIFGHPVGDQMARFASHLIPILASHLIPKLPFSRDQMARSEEGSDGRVSVGRLPFVAYPI